MMLGIIETKLRQIVEQENFNISFIGSVNYYNHEWIKRVFGEPSTPFVLVTNHYEPLGNGDIRFRYTFVALPFEKDKENIEFVYDELFDTLKKETFGDLNIKFRPIKITYGLPFSEGSGAGFKRFEALFEFEGFITKALGFDDLELSIGDIDLNIDSFKFEHAKVNMVAEYDGDNEDNNINLNHNGLVIEAQLKENMSELLNVKSINRVYDIELKGKNSTLVDMPMNLDGWTLGANVSQEKTTVYLFFSQAIETVSIKIDNETIPIIDFAFGMGTISIPHRPIGSNISKNIYGGKVRSWAFNIAEQYEMDLLNLFEEQMFGDDESEPIFDIKFNLYKDGQFVEREMRMLLDDIMKESKETGRSYLTVKFIESGE